MNEVKNRKSRQSNNVKRRVKQPKKNIAKIGIKTKISAFLLHSLLRKHTQRKPNESSQNCQSHRF